MKKATAKWIYFGVLFSILSFSANAMAEVCYLYMKSSYKNNAAGVNCWHQDYLTGTNIAAPAGYGVANSIGGACSPALFIPHVKSTATNNSWTCVQATLNGSVVSTRGAP